MYCDMEHEYKIMFPPDINHSNKVLVGIKHNILFPPDINYLNEVFIGIKHSTEKITNFHFTVRVKERLKEFNKW